MTQIYGKTQDILELKTVVKFLLMAVIVYGKIVSRSILPAVH